MGSLMIMSYLYGIASDHDTPTSQYLVVVSFPCCVGGRGKVLLPCRLGRRLVGHVACDSVTMDTPMRMMSSVAIVMAREKSGTSWELWRLLTRLIWEVRKRREEEYEGGGKGGRKGGEEGREGGKKRMEEGGEERGRKKGMMLNGMKQPSIKSSNVKTLHCSHQPSVSRFDWSCC